MVQGRGMYGELQVVAIDKLGNRHVFSTPNTLTFDASRVASHLLVGDSVSTNKVSKLGVGTSATAPARNNASLAALVHQQSVTEISFPAPGQVIFRTVVDFISSANGNILREAGLFCENGTTLFARQVHADMPKDENYKIEYVWRIVFT